MPEQRAAAGRRPRIRCAIYTRKSHEDGLEQDFNSLHAQREACEAYIKSQAGEGMIALADNYDDGGVSGATMERAALNRLIADVQARKVDTVVVYKVDRLTRSLKDFVRIVEIFDEAGVSFVSVTQSFNTTSSMGRLTLNMLLSFAQFEREVTSERIRDKIAASKRKGLWMGGLPPLGYDVQERKLIINASEADTVRAIFTAYADLGSVRLLKEHLDREGVLSKRRANRFGQTLGGKSLSRGALYEMLQNRLYRGMIVHKGEAFAGQHEPIVDEALWALVQDKLLGHRVERKLGRSAADPSLLAGLIFDADGERLTPTHTNKKGARYRYYVSQGLVRGVRAKHAHGVRLPAADLERLVEQRLALFFRDQAALYAAITPHATTEAAVRLLHRGAEFAKNWSDTSSSEKRTLLLHLIARIEVSRADIRIAVRTARIAAILEGPPLSAPASDAAAHADADILQLTCPASLQRHGMQIRLLIENAEPGAAAADRPLLRLLGQAQLYRDLLLSRSDRSITDIAAEAGVTRSNFTRVLRLSFLAPDIAKAILAGRQPAALSAKRLVAERELPVAWEAQRAVLGFK